MTKMIAFQGELGANSHLACLQAYPDAKLMPCFSFEDVMEAVEKKRADFAILPVENSVAGRVGDLHRLLPESPLFIIAEHFLSINHALLAIKDTSLERLTHVQSHEMALGQCRNFIRKKGLTPVIAADTAGSARQIAEEKDASLAAIASPLAAEIYELQIIAEKIEDADHNTTRFLIMARTPCEMKSDDPAITSMLFRVKNVPSALYKALGALASNGINMTKLESYQVGGSFQATQFYVEIEGHGEQAKIKNALEELSFFTSELHILGSYPAQRQNR